MRNNGEQESSCLDCVTRWNSTLVMYQQTIKLRDIMSCTISNKVIAHEFVDRSLSIDDWNHVSMDQCFLVPSIIFNYMSGSKYPIL